MFGSEGNPKVKKPDALASGFFYFRVVWGGIEPSTQGFSVLGVMV
jgi:hypothetical protein